MSSPTPSFNLNPGPFTEARIGTVVTATPNSLFVDVGGTVMDVAFVLPFTTNTVSPPAPGTVVQLVRQDATWVCYGRLVGQGSNAILNPSFEDSAPGTEPINWFTADVSGSSFATVVDVAAPDGDFAVRVYSGQSSVHYLYSSPIAVNQSDVWSVSASVGGDYDGAALETADSALVALWFANNTDLYPTTSSADTVIQTFSDVPQYPPFRGIYGNVTVPAAAPFMRIALRSTLGADQALVWDNVIARKV